jgi:hypothetical protein
MICIAIAIITWTLSMAETLCEARDQFDNEREFSLWIEAERGGATPRVRSHRRPYRRSYGRREADWGGRGKRRASAAREAGLTAATGAAN